MLNAHQIRNQLKLQSVLCKTLFINYIQHKPQSYTLGIMHLGGILLWIVVVR